ncbi:MAG: Gfo/Idh/MocA family oxidoreductase [Clostridia bacterium]|nr:Gfo/Idh/MocA family oxidoreductase [Clostridia bacterium]
MTFGIIGTNFISERFLASLPFADCRATAVYSRTDARARAFAAQNGIPHAFSSLDEFFASDAFEAVYIASPNACHEEQSIAALRAGKHVLCEKPLAPSLAGAKRMMEAAKACGKTLMEAMRPHHDHLWKQVVSHLSCIGRVRGAHLDYCQYSSRYDAHLAGAYTNAFDPALSNAAMLDIGIYPISMAAMLFGEPKHVCGSSVLLPSGFEGAGEAVLGYETHTVSISYSKIADSAAPSVILGEKGAIRIDKVGGPARVELVLRGGETTVFERTDAPAPDNMHEEVRAFARFAAAGVLTPTERPTLTAIGICDSLRRAAGIVFPSDAV